MAYQLKKKMQTSHRGMCCLYVFICLLFTDNVRAVHVRGSPGHQRPNASKSSRNLLASSNLKHSCHQVNQTRMKTDSRLLRRKQGIVTAIRWILTKSPRFAIFNCTSLFRHREGILSRSISLHCNPSHDDVACRWHAKILNFSKLCLAIYLDSA